MTRYRLRRTGAVDVEFDGELLANQTSHREGATRWMEVRIYRTTTGKYVVEEAGTKERDDDDGRSVVTVVTDPFEIRAALTKRGTAKDPARAGQEVEYLTNVALNALEEAGEKDPAIDAATVETI